MSKCRAPNPVRLVIVRSMRRVPRNSASDSPPAGVMHEWALGYSGWFGGAATRWGDDLAESGVRLLDRWFRPEQRCRRLLVRASRAGPRADLLDLVVVASPTPAPEWRRSIRPELVRRLLAERLHLSQVGPVGGRGGGGDPVPRGALVRMVKGSYVRRTAVTASYTAMAAHPKMLCPSAGLSAAAPGVGLVSALRPRGARRPVHGPAAPGGRREPERQRQ